MDQCNWHETARKGDNIKVKIVDMMFAQKKNGGHFEHGHMKNLMQTWQATDKLPSINLLQANAACQFIF